MEDPDELLKQFFQGTKAIPEEKSMEDAMTDKAENLLQEAYERARKYDFLADVAVKKGVPILHPEEMAKAEKYEELFNEVKKVREESSVSGSYPVDFPEYQQDKRRLLEAVQMLNTWMVDILYMVDASLGQIQNFWSAIAVFTDYLLNENKKAEVNFAQDLIVMKLLVNLVRNDKENERLDPDMSCKGVFGELFEFNSGLFQRHDVWNEFEIASPKNTKKDTSGVEVMLFLWYLAYSNVVDTKAALDNQIKPAFKILSSEDEYYPMLKQLGLVLASACPDQSLVGIVELHKICSNQEHFLNYNLQAKRGRKHRNEGSPPKPEQQRGIQTVSILLVHCALLPLMNWIEKKKAEKVFYDNPKIFFVRLQHLSKGKAIMSKIGYDIAVHNWMKECDKEKILRVDSKAPAVVGKGKRGMVSDGQTVLEMKNGILELKEVVQGSMEKVEKIPAALGKIYDEWKEVLIRMSNKVDSLTESVEKLDAKVSLLEKVVEGNVSKEKMEKMMFMLEYVFLNDVVCDVEDQEAKKKIEAEAKKITAEVMAGGHKLGELKEDDKCQSLEKYEGIVVKDKETGRFEYKEEKAKGTVAVMKNTEKPVEKAQKASTFIIGSPTKKTFAVENVEEKPETNVAYKKQGGSFVIGSVTKKTVDNVEMEEGKASPKTAAAKKPMYKGGDSSPSVESMEDDSGDDEEKGSAKGFSLNFKAKDGGVGDEEKKAAVEKPKDDVGEKKGRPIRQAAGKQTKQIKKRRRIA